MAWRGAVLAVTAALGLLLARPPAPLQGLQERIFAPLPRPAASRGIVVIDIGARDETGAVWTRAATARLVARLAQAKPRVIGLDMLIAGDCDGAPARDLAAALQGQPAVLGLLLSDTPGPALPPARLGLTGPLPLWQAPGAETPCPQLAGHDWAVMALMGEADATVRHVPVAAEVGRRALPGLAVAIAARAEGVLPLIGPAGLRLGARTFALEAGSLRFVASAPADWPARTLPAAAVLAGQELPPEDAVVLIGSSLPERGGLRPSATSPVMPSVQILADAVAGLRSGQLPQRPGWAPTLEGGFVTLAGLLTLLLLLRLRPARAAALAATLAALWAGAAVFFGRGGLLLDPALPVAALALILLTALLGRAAALARAERVLRDRMGQLLPPALVSRLAAQPRLMRLDGETREVTALFTDIEGFSAATSAMGAVEMVARLDAYFALTCAIVLRHGGMIDKLVGDSLHALFNAPLDQPGHEAAALACAAEILTATEVFALENKGFGKTRIGVECGPAVLGDVGFGTRIDYTAHGVAINLAARLQEANKALGTRICIGPTLGARVPGLVPLGETELRSFGRLALYTLRA
ncbi:CHASE2 domain-containing protein [Rhodobacter capsulatus]|uniref:adenylate/guanylate cyclase domain-containing protein n=1 Tax=Rhodobacter capsulatus TaxID=1061 RepID=UPI001142E4BD|nr:adenylate/guanylate cyclase domain-containing protein [Rhodobacter capsulatus]TQD37383.1 adenylate/guanylate cyclase domain-containing protein [Rhodobacter capsulatus]